MKNAITLNRLVISLVALIAVLTSITIAQCMLREGVQNNSVQYPIVEYPPQKVDMKKTNPPLKPEVQVMDQPIGFKQPKKTFSFHSGTQSTEERVSVNTGPYGFDSLDKFIEAFQDHNNYENLPYVVENMNGKMTLIFKREGPQTIRKLEKWGDHGTPFTRVKPPVFFKGSLVGTTYGAGEYGILLETTIENGFDGKSSDKHGLGRLYDKRAGGAEKVITSINSKDVTFTFTFPEEVLIKEFVTFNNHSCNMCEITIDGGIVYSGVIRVADAVSFEFSSQQKNAKARERNISVVKIPGNATFSRTAKVRLWNSGGTKVRKFMKFSEMHFMVTTAADKKKVDDAAAKAAADAKAAAARKAAADAKATTSTGTATPATGAASAAPADQTTAAAAAAATTAAVSAAADTGTSSMDASTLAAVGAAAAVTAAEEVAAVEEDTSSSYEAAVIDSSTSSESTPLFGTAINGHLDPAFRMNNLSQDGSTMSSYDSNMASQYHGASPYGGVPVHHHYHPPQHIHHPYEHSHYPYSYSHHPMDKSVVIKHELSDEAEKKITKTMNFMEYIIKNSQKP